MRRIPSRLPLVQQVAEILRTDVQEGRWTESLPGEHHLSDLLQVSRSTMRKALALLQHEGMLRVSRGRRRHLTHNTRTPRPPPSTVVGLVCSLPLQEHSTRSIIVVDELRRHLQEAGLTLQLHFLPQFNKKTGNARLRSLVREARAACWILWSCSANVQRWFAQHSQPVLVQGSCHEGVTLPFFRLDLAAVCRHATGLLHRLGHRRIVLLLPKSPFAGTMEIEESFLETWARLAIAPDPPIIRHIDNSPAAVESVLATLMRATVRPSALLVMMPGHTLTAHCFLLRRGFHIPRDVSLVSILDDLFLQHVTPSLTRYAFGHASFARRMSRIVIKLARTGVHPPSTTQFPDFLKGATIGAPSSP